MLGTSAIPCLLVQSVRERHCYLSLSFLKFKNISGTLFVVCFVLNTLYWLFCGILICKYVSRMYLVAVWPLNRQYTVCLLVYKCRRSDPPLSSCHLAFKNINLFSCFKTSKYFGRTLLYAFQPLKTSTIAFGTSKS